MKTLSDDDAVDLGKLQPDGREAPALVAFKRDGDRARWFRAREMPKAMAAPGQDSRAAPAIAVLWSILDPTPKERGTHWCPKLHD